MAQKECDPKIVAYNTHSRLHSVSMIGCFREFCCSKLGAPFIALILISFISKAIGIVLIVLFSLFFIIFFNKTSGRYSFFFLIFLH